MFKRAIRHSAQPEPLSEFDLSIETLVFRDSILRDVSAGAIKFFNDRNFNIAQREEVISRLSDLHTQTEGYLDHMRSENLREEELIIGGYIRYIRPTREGI